MLCVIVWLELHGAGALELESHISTSLLLLWLGFSNIYLWCYSPANSENIYVRAQFDRLPQSYIGML